MALSFLFYRADKTLLLFCSFLLFLLSPHLYHYMYYTSLFLLFRILPLCLSNSTLLCILHTTYYTTAPCLETLAPSSPESSFPYNYIPCTPQKSPLLLVLSTPLCTLLLPLEAALLLHYAPSPSSICHAVVLLLPPFFLSSLDTPTSYVPYPHIQSIMASLSLLLASSLPSIHTALLYSSIPQTIPHHCLLLLFFFSSIISGKMPKPPTLSAQPPFSPF